MQQIKAGGFFFIAVTLRTGSKAISSASLVLATTCLFG
jgi:hypothetical protein